jgi:LacI family transcriptional regulator, gluconate utilization system Gnt-I transcriptional repressor
VARRVPSPSEGPVRMKDVARRARVSTITVSRALFQPDIVADATRRRVLRTVEELGYIPNLVAGSLSSNRTRAIAAIIPYIGKPVYGRTIQAVSDVLRANGLHLLLGSSGLSLTEEASLIAAFLAHRPEGMLLHGRRHTPEARQQLLRASIPIVETGDLSAPPLDMVVSYSNTVAAKAMTDYLLDKGYRRIAFVSLPVRKNDRHLRRRRGFLTALRERGLAPDPRALLEIPSGFRHGAEALVELLCGTYAPDAVFFASEYLAVGAQMECLRRGWSVPERVAIAGFDDQEEEFAAEAVPPLTTVRIPREEIGRLAGQMLVDRLAGKPVEPRVVNAGFEIVARASA